MIRNSTITTNILTMISASYRTKIHTLIMAGIIPFILKQAFHRRGHHHHPKAAITDSLRQTPLTLFSRSKPINGRKYFVHAFVILYTIWEIDRTPG